MKIIFALLILLPLAVEAQKSSVDPDGVKFDKVTSLNLAAFNKCVEDLGAKIFGTFLSREIISFASDGNDIISDGAHLYIVDSSKMKRAANLGEPACTKLKLEKSIFHGEITYVDRCDLTDSCGQKGQVCTDSLRTGDPECATNSSAALTPTGSLKVRGEALSYIAILFETAARSKRNDVQEVLAEGHCPKVSSDLKYHKFLAALTPASAAKQKTSAH